MDQIIINNNSNNNCNSNSSHNNIDEHILVLDFKCPNNNNSS